MILDEYVSNTVAANGNQVILKDCKPDLIQHGLVFVKINKGGTFPYVFAYSGIIDCTFGDGSISKCNTVSKPWKIHGLSYSLSNNVDPEEINENEFKELTFKGNKSIVINGDELVSTDPTEITAVDKQYICLKIAFSGEEIPYHEESIIAIYKKDEAGKYVTTSKVPIPVFTGIKRNVKKKIGFIGDSITQGLGTDYNSYKHYASVVADIIGEDYGYWDLGLGYARAWDASSNGIWINKAVHNDIIIVCLGTNDILFGRKSDEIIDDLKEIVNIFNKHGLKIILQTLPPFDYQGECILTWKKVNEYIRNELKAKVYALFDEVPLLSNDGTDSPLTKYGPHPNNEGNRIWGENLASFIKALL